MKSLSFRSFAKINIGLWILSHRKDGYHNITTVYQQIDLHDVITFQKRSTDIRITSTNPSMPLDKNNLVFKAFQLFQEKIDIQEGLEIHIEKNIPMGGGLGGGSSNAAATLQAANHLWNDPLDKDELNAMAVNIGSDVPFFLKGGTVFGQGRGDLLTPLNWTTDYWIVLACPTFGVSTSWAYKQSKIALTKEEKFTKLMSILERFSPHTLKDNFQNELESVVFRRHPILREIKELMYQRDAFYAGMSGSGSSIYGLFFQQKTAVLAKTFFSIQKGLTTYLCKPILPYPTDKNMGVEQKC
ncbi:4-(cytidine 5'-diphospho)-2-C-methyl-D-erythritol kinase [bacterium]|nr:4-(cytidine 5'-diphospho)-2-C-methyl-D-erythritol kinase [bacterium]